MGKLSKIKFLDLLKKANVQIDCTYITPNNKTKFIVCKTHLYQKTFVVSISDKYILDVIKDYPSRVIVPVSKTIGIVQRQLDYIEDIRGNWDEYTLGCVSGDAISSSNEDYYLIKHTTTQPLQTKSTIDFLEKESENIKKKLSQTTKPTKKIDIDDDGSLSIEKSDSDSALSEEEKLIFDNVPHEDNAEYDFGNLESSGEGSDEEEIGYYDNSFSDKMIDSGIVVGCVFVFVGLSQLTKLVSESLEEKIVNAYEKMEEEEYNSKLKRIDTLKSKFNDFFEKVVEHIQLNSDEEKKKKKEIINLTISLNQIDTLKEKYSKRKKTDKNVVDEALLIQSQLKEAISNNQLQLVKDRDVVREIISDMNFALVRFNNIVV